MTTFKSVLLNFMEMLMYRSLVTVAHSRGESALSLRLAKIAPDHENQYTSFVIPKENKYLTQKVQNQHAFQMNLLLKTIAKFRDEFGQGRDIKLADIGDSAGAPTFYFKII